MEDFKGDFDSMQAQQNLGESCKIEQMLFDENGITRKIKMMINANDEQEKHIDILEKLQNEVFTNYTDANVKNVPVWFAT